MVDKVPKDLDLVLVLEKSIDPEGKPEESPETHVPLKPDLRCRVLMIERLSTALIVMGVISMVTGIPTVILVLPIPSIPFITGSGIWTGALVMAVGLLGLAVRKEAENDITPKLYKLSIATQVLSLLATHVSFLHAAWCVWGIIGCLTNPHPGQGSSAQCGVNTAGIVIQSAYGIIIGLSMAIGCVLTSLSISGLIRAIRERLDTLGEEVVV